MRNPKTNRRRSSLIPHKGLSVNGKKLKKANCRKLTKGRISFRQGFGGSRQPQNVINPDLLKSDGKSDANPNFTKSETMGDISKDKI